MTVSETIWELDPHTKAKHEILEYYLKAWFPILAGTPGRIIYLDAFAGPGIYKNGEDGSPIIALRTATDHKHKQKFKAEIRFAFVECDKQKANVLRNIIETKFAELPVNMSYKVFDEEFTHTLDSVLNKIEEDGAKLAPTFAFIDPFGFSGVPMKLIGRLMAYNKCEVLITFMSGFINRFADEQREATLNDFFGTNDWKEIHNIDNPEDRKKFWLDLYTGQLKLLGGVTLIRSFEMIGEHNQTLYHLVYGTKDWRGLKAMKEAMWRVDRRGTYRFSDVTDVNQKYLIDYSDEKEWIPIVAELVFDEFIGQTVTISEIEQFVIINTPYIFRKEILKHLEKLIPPKIVKVLDRKRQFTYPEGCSITFSEQ